MKIGIFIINEVDGLFRIERHGEVFEICPSLKEAIHTVNIFMRIHELSYKMGYSQRNNEVIESKEYHYM